jgi:hypothetical protein
MRHEQPKSTSQHHRAARGLRLARLALRRVHRQRAGMVIEQLLLWAVAVLPVAAAVPTMLWLLARTFYRVSAVVTGPFP